MAVPTWSPKAPRWNSETFNVLTLNEIKQVPKQNLKNITKQSDKFQRKFPVDTGKCKYLKKYANKEVLERNINSAYPIIHESVLELCCNFVLFKRRHGSEKEKAFYANMGLGDFITRLLRKRAVMFVGVRDLYLLMDGDYHYGGLDWKFIGTDEEVASLSIENCLTYDEIKLSAFLSVSSYTYFVNKGDRTNAGMFQTDRQNVEDEGVIIGLIGPRLVKRFVMEYQDIIISPDQNVVHNGYGSTATPSIPKLFSEFYEENCLTYEETAAYKKTLPASDERYECLPGCIFDNHQYYKRLAISMDTLLMEANYRAKSKGTTAYVHVVGIGLGVWKIGRHQEKVFMDSFAKRLSCLGPKLHSVSDVCLSYINENTCGGIENGQIFPIEDHPLNGIRIHIFRRGPNEKLVGDNAGKLLVVSYAWDANALPGNEYWSGSLESSSDPAAACSTQIAEIHNPHINPLVCSDRLMVVTQDDVVSLENYIEIIRIQMPN